MTALGMFAKHSCYVYSVKIAPLHEMAVLCVKYVQHKVRPRESAVICIFGSYLHFIYNTLLVLCTCLQGHIFCLVIYYFVIGDKLLKTHMDISSHSFCRICGLEKGRFFKLVDTNCLSSLSTDSAGQLDVLGHDGDTLGMDSTQVGILKQTNQVSFTGLLQSHDSRALETQVSLEILGNFSHQALEGKLADEQLSTFLVPTDLPESHSSRPVTMGLLDSSSGWSTLPCSLGSQLLPWGLASSRFPCSLLSSCHFSKPCADTTV